MFSFKLMVVSIYFCLAFSAFIFSPYIVRPELQDMTLTFLSLLLLKEGDTETEGTDFLHQPVVALLT